jgi:multicomponent Na+:H+ antiporter subunit F
MTPLMPGAIENWITQGALTGATFGMLVAMLMVLARLYIGPSVYDRVLAANAFGTKTVLFIALLGFLNGRPDFLDIGLLYALINFVSTIAILKYFRYRGFGDCLPGLVRSGQTAPASQTGPTDPSARSKTPAAKRAPEPERPNPTPRKGKS